MSPQDHFRMQNRNLIAQEDNAMFQDADEDALPLERPCAPNSFCVRKQLRRKSSTHLRYADLTSSDEDENKSDPFSSRCSDDLVQALSCTALQKDLKARLGYLPRGFKSRRQNYQGFGTCYTSTSEQRRAGLLTALGSVSTPKASFKSPSRQASMKEVNESHRVPHGTENGYMPTEVTTFRKLSHPPGHGRFSRLTAKRDYKASLENRGILAIRSFFVNTFQFLVSIIYSSLRNLLHTMSILFNLFPSACKKLKLQKEVRGENANNASVEGNESSDIIARTAASSHAKDRAVFRSDLQYANLEENKPNRGKTTSQPMTESCQKSTPELLSSTVSTAETVYQENVHSGEIWSSMNIEPDEEKYQAAEISPSRRDVYVDYSHVATTVDAGDGSPLREKVENVGKWIWESRASHPSTHSSNSSGGSKKFSVPSKFKSHDGSIDSSGSFLDSAGVQSSPYKVTGKHLNDDLPNSSFKERTKRKRELPSELPPERPFGTTLERDPDELVTPRETLKPSYGVGTGMYGRGPLSEHARLSIPSGETPFPEEELLGNDEEIFGPSSNIGSPSPFAFSRGDQVPSVSQLRKRIHKASSEKTDVKTVADSIRRAFARHKSERETRFTSPRSAEKTLTLIADLLAKDFNCIVAVRKSGPLKLRCEKVYSAGKVLRTRVTFEVMDKFSCEVTIARSREDDNSVSTADYVTFVARLQRSFLDTTTGARR